MDFSGKTTAAFVLASSLFGLEGCTAAHYQQIGNMPGQAGARSEQVLQGVGRNAEYQMQRGVQQGIQRSINNATRGLFRR